MSIDNEEFIRYKELVAHYEKFTKQLDKRSPEWIAVNMTTFDINHYLSKLKSMIKQFENMPVELTISMKLDMAGIRTNLEGIIGKFDESYEVRKSDKFIKALTQ